MEDDIYNYYEDCQDENLKINDKFNKNLIKINSTTMRISVLEDRTKSLEKMLRLFEERMNLKEEEKANDLKGIESNSNLINKLNKKIKYLEKQLTEFIAQKQISDQENEKKIEKHNERIQFLETQIKNEQNVNNDFNEKEFSLNEKSSNIILNDFNELIKSNNLQIDEYIQEKIYNTNVDNENKINELLNLIQEINKIVEENENKINILNTNFNKFQNDNVNVIQTLSIQEEKINSIDFVNEELKKLKLKFNEIVSCFEDKNEEISQKKIEEKNYTIHLNVNIKTKEKELQKELLEINFIESLIQKEPTLIIKIKAQNDPFLLLSLELKEKEYQQFKDEQSLLVDFQNFFDFVLKMLNFCKNDKNGIFSCLLSIEDKLAVLSIEEKTQYRKFNHLILKFKEESDINLKNHFNQIFLL